MFWLALSWIIVSPYTVGLVIARSPRLRGMVARHIALVTTIGWTALTILALGVFRVSGTNGLHAALAAALFGGLAFWARSRRDDGGDEPRPEDVPPPFDDFIDWDGFLRDVNAWSRKRTRA